MCFPNNYNLTNVRNEGINCVRVKQEWYDEGKTQIQSPGGNKIMVYSMERTLCDILRKRGGLDKGIVAEAFKRYVVRTADVKELRLCIRTQLRTSIKYVSISENSISMDSRVDRTIQLKVRVLMIMKKDV